MTFLPIVDRELRVASRRAGTYWTRLLAALVAMALLVYLLIILPVFSASPTVGARMFSTLSFLALVYVLLSGVRITADCLSEEKREGTLGLLFLTDLKSHDVVLGKLAATSLNAFYGLLAILPVLAIPILFGGVSAADFWRTALLLGNGMFFSLCAGLFISAVSRVARKASGGTFMVVLMFTAGLPMIGGILERRKDSNPVSEFLYECSPWFPATLMDRANLSGSVKEFWTSITLVHGFSWIFLMLACFILPRLWQDKPAAGRRRRWGEWVRDLHFGNAAERKAFRTRALAVNPLFWLASRVRLARSYPWIFLIAIAAIGVWGWQLDHQLFLVGGALALCYITHVFFKIWVAGMAGQSFAADRDRGALELLLSTPLTVPEMLHGQWLALRRQFGWPVLAVLAVNVALTVTRAIRADDGTSEPGLWMLMMAANTIVFVADLFALGWLGMWEGVKARRAQSATLRTLALVLLLPWAVLLLILLADAKAGGRAGNPFAYVFVWLGLSLAVDATIVFRARESLLGQLRRVATERFSRTPGKTAPAEEE